MNATRPKSDREGWGVGGRPPGPPPPGPPPGPPEPDPFDNRGRDVPCPSSNDGPGAANPNRSRTRCASPVIILPRFMSTSNVASHPGRMATLCSSSLRRAPKASPRSNHHLHSSVSHTYRCSPRREGSRSLPPSTSPIAQSVQLALVESIGIYRGFPPRAHRVMAPHPLWVSIHGFPYATRTSTVRTDWGCHSNRHSRSSTTASGVLARGPWRGGRLPPVRPSPIARRCRVRARTCRRPQTRAG